MPKRRKAKTSKKSKQSFKDQLKYELIGILLIFLAVFGSGASSISEGAIPAILENLFRFIFGVWYFVVSLFLLGLGIYLMIKRRIPFLFNRRLSGFYIIFLGIILLTHIQSFNEILTDSVKPSIIKTTWGHIWAYLDGQVPAANLGGGMVGAILFAFSHFLFSAPGARFLSLFAILIGILFLTEFSIGAFIEKSWDRWKAFVKTQMNHWNALREKKSKEKEEKRETKEMENDNEIYTQELEIEPLLNAGQKEEEPIIQEFTDIAYSNENNNQSKKVNKKSEKTKKEDPEDEKLLESLPMTELENFDYELPSLELLAEPVNNTQQQERGQIQAVVRKLERTFHSFGVKAKVTKVHVGPAVTKYEIYPDVGVKVSKIVNLHDDLALALAAKDIRIEAPIPGKSAIGIEVPNHEIATVSLREVLDTKQAMQGSKLAFVLGRDISGDAVIAELNRMPHLLVAGATGSGKSVCINGIITSILMRAKPHEVKMMMIDPKKVELNVYNGIPHLLAPVVTDPKKASRALKKVVSEMERRYELFSDTGTRNIEGYNEYIKRYNAAEGDNQPQLPYIVVLVDELADLMMVASGDVEDAITRLAQMARAAGIHLIIATQRPSVDVITGVIKANIPSRIAFSVSSATDSRTILDSGGAEKLLGRGDMLFIPVGSSKPTRIQGAFLSDEEVERIVDHCIEQQKAQYQDDMIPEEETEVANKVDDDLFDDAVQLVIEMQSASVSMLQRRFRVGYTRAARLIDAMEDRGIVGPYEGSKPRTVLVSDYTEEKSS
ncbi:DNA translocase FtsK [Aquibacillus koreensis]|uniref:DNA translocase FtsK n=1 Tax=Aquibacillus koreensis TaxID=279446 RepID=A0A9X4AJI2_9BACI|nr:DNA translocase FtsK [Aquibacillus koreensis]MCT2534582.1 DNA translocase FtsK [Aquibacillus koreensis]MDC3421824.1 DNA translocase FtsK [Aquibacillus koreensis]